MHLLFDSHLDLAWNALSFGRDLKCPVAEINRRESGMSDHASRGRAMNSLPEMRRGGMAVCLSTILAGADPDMPAGQTHDRLSLEYPNQEMAYAVGMGQLAYYRLLEEQGQVAMLRTAADLKAHWARWQQPERSGLPVGFILAMEGADPIINPEQAEAWWNQGLRCASLVHFGRSRYAVGTGKSGPLTADGRALLAKFRRLGMILDVTHLCDQSFFEALDVFDGPVMASHNNCRALVPGDRQFSDEQIRRLIARDGVIGVCIDAWMLLPGWEIGRTSRERVGVDAVADQIDHICQLAGDSRHVGFGTDTDGGYGTEQAPTGLETLADLHKVGEVLSGRGYTDDQIGMICHGNWLRFFLRHLPQ